MKIQIFSDLHNEFAPFEPPSTDASRLAGDIDTQARGVSWANEVFIPKRTQDSFRISQLKSDPVEEGNRDVLDKNLWSRALGSPFSQVPEGHRESTGSHY